MTARTIEVSDAIQPLADYAQQAEDGPLVVTLDGRPIAVVVAVENADLETISLSQNPQFLALIERSRRRQQRDGALSHEAGRQRLGLPLRERPNQEDAQ